jgi:hypothetical protein
VTQEWNVPIDKVQADCLTLRSIIRGWISQAKEEVGKWEPRPCPPR